MTTTALIILDGWGHSERMQYNAIYHAYTPTWDKLWAEHPATLVSGSGLDVGLPDGQMGNSEVGHMTLGAGRIIWQNLTRIDLAIKDGSFFENTAYVNAIDSCIKQGTALHIVGLLSPGGVHSHDTHVFAAIKMAAQRGCKKVYLHAFLDGRDTAPRSAKASIEQTEALFDELQCGQIASIIGRYYAMDRDNNWQRVDQAYNVIVDAQAPYTERSASEALEASYQRDEDDEFVKPISIIGAEAMVDGDAVIFMNFRSDRARQLTRAMTQPLFDGFKRSRIINFSEVVTTTEYADDINANVAFTSAAPINNLGEYLQSQNKTQLRIAETEKYAHVTFFFSGGREAMYEGETRILINSPKVATYDLQPEMSAYEVTDKLVEAIHNKQFDSIICNFANGDMVGHTGNFEAAIKAVETLDTCLLRITNALKSVQGQCLITADHGNVESMLDQHSGQPLTSHTSLPVPLVYFGEQDISLKDGGTLADIAPSVLSLMKLDIPEEMTGKSLIG